MCDTADATEAGALIVPETSIGDSLLARVRKLAAYIAMLSTRCPA